MTIAKMTAGIKNNELKSRELVSQYLAMIESTKDLNAVIEINPDALAIAERLDSSKNKDGVFYGIPILIKDNISTADKMHTIAGSLALEENIAPIDAPIVKLLREAGAVILGKTNMTEFANYMAKEMPNGYSSRGGQCLNYFNPKVDPSGSSTGSAIAVAADLCAASIGTETCGSIISPAQNAGIIGIKPTVGLINTEAIIPISFTLDTAGPMCRNAEDTALLLGLLAGKKYEIDYNTNIKGLRIGICRQSPKYRMDEYDSQWMAANEKLILSMESVGAINIELGDHGINTNFFYHIMQYEFKYALNAYLKTMANPKIPQSLAEIITFNKNHADTACKYGQDILEKAEETASGTMTEPEYLEAMIAREKAILSLEKIFMENNIDLIFMTEGDFSIAATTGYPSITFPIGYKSNGLPIGSFFIGRKFCEDKLLSIVKLLAVRNEK